MARINPVKMIWAARILIGTVLFFNGQCALQFIFLPGGYVSAFELSGAAGLAARRAAPGDIQFMEKSLDEMKTEINEGRTGTEAGRLPLPWRRVLPGMPPYSS